jgi:hypothetical protein
MQESNANRNPEWDAIIGDNTVTGTIRLMGLIFTFAVTGGTVIHLLSS